jgi:hypothetical protein
LLAPAVLKSSTAVTGKFTTHYRDSIPNWMKETGSVNGTPINEETVADIGKRITEASV